MIQIPKTKTYFFVLEAPRDQDLGLEDWTTVHHCIPLDTGRHYEHPRGIRYSLRYDTIL